MSSLTPLGGRLSQIFSPGTLLLATSIIMSAGLFTTASAPTLPAFLLGRVVTGCGSAGIYSTTVILILALASKKRRGLFIGLSATSYTTGLATGAVLAGAVTPKFGWVGS
jgi:MFS family permease